MTVLKNGVAPAVDVGGLYGINVETLADNKTLTPGTDEIYQYLDEGGADREVTLATVGAAAGDRFVVRHNGSFVDTHYIRVKQAAVTLDDIYPGGIKAFIFDGTNWISGNPGAGEDGTRAYNTSMGRKARVYSEGAAFGNLAVGYTNGAAFGSESQGYTQGAACGYKAKGYTYGAALGAYAEGYNKGLALGYRALTNAKEYSIALGHRSECERTGETSININGGDTDQENNVVQGRWEGETTDADPVEIFLAGQANERFTIRVSSVLAFRMTIVARDNVAGHMAMYTVDDGLIKRDGADNTVLVTGTIVVVHEDDAAWDVAITADDGNEALIITVTGDDTNPVQWAVVMDGVETHF